MATVEQTRKDFPNSKRVSSNNDKKYYIQIWMAHDEHKRDYKWYYLADGRNHYNDDDKIRTTDSHHNAKPFWYNASTLMSELTRVLSRLDPKQDARIVEVSTTVNTTVLAPEEDLLVERLRNSGLSKLNEREMLALGLQDLATYDKLKFYKTDDAIKKD